MNKKIYKLLLASCLAISASTSAQTYELSVNKMVKNKIKPIEFIGKDNQGNIYVAANRPKLKMYLPLMAFNYIDIDVEKYIKKYDKDLNLISEQEILSENPLVRQSQINGRGTFTSILYWGSLKEKNMNLPNFMVDNKYYMVIQGDKTFRNSYSVAEIDIESGALRQATHILTLSKNKNEKTLPIKDFKISFSPDSNYILFLATYQRDRTSKTGVAYSSAVFSRDMKPIFNSNYALPKASKKFNIKDARLSNDAEILILGRYYDSKQKQNPGYVSVYSVDQKNIKPKETRLKFGADKVNDAMLSFNTNNQPLITGFYKNNNKKRGYDGMFYASLNQSKELYDIQKNEFKSEFIASDYTVRAAKKLAKKEKKGKDIKEDSDFGFSEFIKTDDGGYMAVAETYYVQQVTRTSTSTHNGVTTTRSRTDYHHHYDDLMIFKFDKDAKLQTMNKIAKRTTYISASPVKIHERDYTSFSMDGDVYLVFNDDPSAIENNRRSNDKTKNDATYIVNIKPNGQLKKDVLIPARQLGAYTFDPHKKLQPIGNGKMAFIANKNARNKKTMMGYFAVRKS